MSWSTCYDDFSDVNQDFSSRRSFNQVSSFSLPNQNNFDESSNGGYISIAHLSPGISSQSVVGVIIAKEEPRHFLSKKDPGSERHLLSFTLRDSVADFINVTCWGGEMYIRDLESSYHIGDIVEMSGVNVQSKPTDGSDEKYRPWTPSMFHLNLSEHKSTMKLYGGWNIEKYSTLLHIPVKAGNDFSTIGDIMENYHSISSDTSVSLLAVVRQVNSVKTITTKTGKKMRLCEVIVFDETASRLPLYVWNQELIMLCENWAPKETVLFVADVRISYSDYHQCLVANANSKTVITVNPDTSEAQRLYQYAMTADISIDPERQDKWDNNQVVDLDTITEVQRIKDIKSTILSAQTHLTGGLVYCITYAFISTLDIDTQNINLAIATKCAKCFKFVDAFSGCCLNQDCPQGSLMGLDADTTEKEISFDLRLALSDHTGTLTVCRVNGQVAEAMLGVSVNQYLQMGDISRTNLKWGYLLERCKVYLKINLPDAKYPRPIIKVIGCSVADPLEVARNLK